MEAIINECLFFRRGFPGLLVEPETVSQELKIRWESHRSQCEKCNSLFERAQSEQHQVHELLLQLPEYLALSNGVGFSRSTENFSREVRYKAKRKRGLAGGSWITVAASVLLIAALVAGWIGGYTALRTPQNIDSASVGGQEWQTDLGQPPAVPDGCRDYQGDAQGGSFHLNYEEMRQAIAQRITHQLEKISANPAVADAQSGLALNATRAAPDHGEIKRVTEEIMRHIETTHKELAALGKLHAESKNLPSSGELLLSHRLNLQCQLALSTPDSLGRMGSPKDAAQAIEKFIQSQLPSLGLDEQGKQVAAGFFHKASPHLLSILNGRNSLINELGANTVRNLGGELETLMLILSLEDINCLQH